MYVMSRDTYLELSNLTFGQVVSIAVMVGFGVLGVLRILRDFLTWLWE